MKKHSMASLVLVGVIFTTINAENISPRTQILFDKGVCVGETKSMACQYRQVNVDITGNEWLDKELLSAVIDDKLGQAANSTLSELKQRILQYYQQELDEGVSGENGKKYVLNSVDEYHKYLDKYKVASVGRFSKLTEIKFLHQNHRQNAPVTLYPKKPSLIHQLNQYCLARSHWSQA